MWLEALRTDSGYIILKDPSDQDRKLDRRILLPIQ